MAFTAAQIVSHPKLLTCIREQSRMLLQAYDSNARLGAVFATQQRWLLAHIGLALHFRRADTSDGMTMARFLHMVEAHDVASRNTAEAFLKEMLRYDVVRLLPSAWDKRIHPMEPAEQTLTAIRGWAMVHLATLDCVDGGGRTVAFAADPGLLALFQPKIADGLLVSETIRAPVRTFSLFTWLNNGGVIMDWLIAGLSEPDANTGRYTTPVASVAEMAGWLKLSRTHLARKLREAEALGSIGWGGQRGHSAMWVSKGFVDEIIIAQSAKLAIIDEAFEECRPQPRQITAITEESTQ